MTYISVEAVRVLAALGRRAKNRAYTFTQMWRAKWSIGAGPWLDPALSEIISYEVPDHSVAYCSVAFCYREELDYWMRHVVVTPFGRQGGPDWPTQADIVALPHAPALFHPILDAVGFTRKGAQVQRHLGDKLPVWHFTQLCGRGDTP